MSEIPVSLEVALHKLAQAETSDEIDQAIAEGAEALVNEFFEDVIEDA